MDKAGIEDLFRPFGRVDVKRMFGGHGVYADGVMFALEARGELYLRVDAQTLPAFAARGLAPFVHESRGRMAALPYRRLPEEAHEDERELIAWSRLALEAARRVKRGAGSKAARGGPHARTAAPERR